MLILWSRQDGMLIYLRWPGFAWPVLERKRFAETSFGLSGEYLKLLLYK